MKAEEELTLPVVSISRLRMETDGAGVTTLVVSHGCPLRCKYCINPFTWRGRTRARLHTPQSLADELKKDSLYFLATGGGVTFGGGESLLHAAFLQDFRKRCGDAWRIYAETSLHVPRALVASAAETVDGFIIAIKEMTPEIYRRYTTADARLIR